MYFAHAGHEHSQAVAQASNQMLCIACAVLLSVALLAIIVVLDIRRSRATEKLKSK